VIVLQGELEFEQLLLVSDPVVPRTYRDVAKAGIANEQANSAITPVLRHLKRIASAFANHYESLSRGKL